MHLLMRVGLLIGGVLFARRTHANDTRRASLTRTLIMRLRNYFSTVQFLFLFCISILLSQRYVCLGLFCVPSKRNAIRAAAAANNLCSSRLPLSVLPISPCATSIQNIAVVINQSFVQRTTKSIVVHRVALKPMRPQSADTSH